MKTFVFDTSAIIRLYVPDGPLPALAEAAISAAWRAEAVALVPELGLVEVAQVLHKKVSAQVLTTREADEILSEILTLPLEVIGHRDLLGAAVDHARLHRLTVYDSMFLTLALDRAATLISADEALLAAYGRASGESLIEE